MPTLANLLLEVAQCLLMPRFSNSTGGGTQTTLVDIRLEEPDQLFDGGTIWFITGVLAGRTAIITSWDEPTKTFTFPVQIAAPGAGIQYAVLDARYPRDELIGAVNDALQELGPLDAKDDTLTVVADQDIYTLPAGVSHLTRLQYSIETAAPYHWAPPDHYWKEYAGELWTAPAHRWYPGSQMRLWYLADHPRVYLDADLVTEDVYHRRIAWMAAWSAARARNSRPETSDGATIELEKKCERMAMTLEREHPIRRMTRDETWIDLP